MAALLPFLIHLFNKQKKKKIQFSSLLFLKVLEKQRLKKLKIFQYLLILIRTLLIILLVLAFARPTLTGENLLTGKTARTTAVIVIDDGVNMQAFDNVGNRFNRAVSTLHLTLESFSPEDDVFIIKAHNPTASLDRETITNDLICTYYSPDWNIIFDETAKIFNNHPNFNKELYLISDFRFNDHKFPEQLSQLSNVRKYFFKIGENELNDVSIDTLVVKSRLLEANRTINIEALVKNNSFEETREIEMHMFVNDKRVANRRIVLDNMESKTVDLAFQPKISGNLNAYVEIDDDDLIPGNRFYFSLNIPKITRVMFVDDNPSSFLSSALQTIQSNSNIEIKTERYASWARNNFNQFHVIILSNFGSFSASILDRLVNFLQDNGTMILIPGNNTLPVDFNKNLSRITSGITIHDLIKSSGINEYFSLNQLILNHPVFDGLFKTSSPQISEAHFYRYFKISYDNKSEPILSFNNKHPFILHKPVKEGNIYFLTSYIDEQWTDLQYKGLFIPLLLRLIQLGTTDAAQHNKSVFTENESLINLNSAWKSSEYWLNLPSGDKIKILPVFSEQSLFFELNLFTVPGNYFLNNQSGLLTIISANINTSKISPPFIDTSQLKDINLLNENEDFTSAIQETRFGEELWKYFLFLALLILLIEFIIIKKIEGRNSI